jgi:Carbon monoxide dehydrogenase subunit G (CoxG)
VQLSDLDPPNAYRISGEGSGGVAGFAKGGANVRLESESSEVTVLHYAVDAQVGGKVAQLGDRLIDGTAKKLAGEFFVRFAPTAVTEPAVEQKAGWLGRFTGVTSVALLLALGGLNWCCLLGIHLLLSPQFDRPLRPSVPTQEPSLVRKYRLVAKQLPDLCRKRSWYDWRWL